MQMKIIANEMLPVYETDKGNRAVDARELHSQLLVGKDFSTWIKQRIDRYGFIEGEDFSPILGNSDTSTTGANIGRQRKDYLLTLDTAKEIAMVENNEQGRSIRKYFIQVEKKARQQQEKPKTHAEMFLDQAKAMVEYEKRINNLESQAAAAHHRIDNFDRIDTIGNPQQRLNKMIRLYAGQQGLTFQQAWRNFKGAFNTSFRTNLTMLIENYKMKHNLKKLSTPEYFSKVDRLDDAIRVADKLLNQSQGGVSHVGR